MNFIAYNSVIQRMQQWSDRIEFARIQNRSILFSNIGVFNY